MTATPLWQSWFFGCTVVIAMVTMTFIEPSLTLQPMLLMTFVAIFGLPHGALDLPLAEALLPLEKGREKIWFIAVYLGFALLVIGIWIVFPGPSLLAFLIYSAFHFSGDWQDSRSILRWTGGIATIGAPALFRTNDVTVFFEYLAPQSSASLAADCLAVAAGIALLVLVASLFLLPSLRTRAATEQAFIFIAAACLTPLVYFVLYFCILHSIRHFTQSIAFIGHRHRALPQAILVCIVTILIATASFFVLHDGTINHIAPSAVKVVFIGLAALTVPHMILIAKLQYQNKLQPNRVSL
jgi:Brp/Blh family beta-carotene 15,15'-monooxygenase